MQNLQISSIGTWLLVSFLAALAMAVLLPRHWSWLAILVCGLTNVAGAVWLSGVFSRLRAVLAVARVVARRAGLGNRDGAETRTRGAWHENTGNADDDDADPDENWLRSQRDLRR